MAKKKKEEKHITVLTGTFTKLEQICEHEKRTYRAEVTKFIDEKHAKLFGKGK